MNDQAPPTSADLYPECTKALAIRDKSQELGNFIENSGYILCTEEQKGITGFSFVQTRKSTEQILADHFELDLVKMELERQAMLEAIQS